MPPRSDYGPRQLEKLFSRYTRGLCDEKELGHHFIHVLIETRWFDGIETNIERLPLISREAARNYAHEIADPGYNYILWGIGGAPPGPEQRASILATMKEVARRVLAALEDKPA